jgi:hypothetical protein
MASKGKPVQLGEQTVHLAFNVPISGPATRVRVVRVDARPDPVQGICLKPLPHSFVHVAGQRGRAVVLWADVAPAELVVELSGIESSDSVLQIWNCWRGKYGQADAWIGNSGLVCETPSGPVYRFRCSDGPGKVAFDALVFTVEVIDGDSGDRESLAGHGL